MSAEYIHSDHNLETRYTDFDFCDDLRLSSYLALLQEASSRDAERLGFGASYLWPRNWGFIVTNVDIEIYKKVETDEPLTIRTWPLPPNRFIFERDCEVFDKNGEKVAASVARWCLFDLTNQKILSEANMPVLDKEHCRAEQSFPFNGWKIPLFDISGDPSFEMIVQPSDCDRYIHVNNTKYADFCMNCFSKEFWEENTASNFHIVFEKQCKMGEKLRFFKTEFEEDKFRIIGVKEDGSSFMRAELSVKKRG